MWNRREVYVSIKLSFLITELLFVNVYKLFLWFGYFCPRDLRESCDIVFFGEIFLKLLRDLPAPDLFLPANDRFSISVFFFGVRWWLQFGICRKFRLYLFLFIMSDTLSLNIIYYMTYITLALHFHLLVTGLRFSRDIHSLHVWVLRVLEQWSTFFSVIIFTKLQ